MAIQICREVNADVIKRGVTKTVYAKQHDLNSRFLNVRIQEEGRDIVVAPTSTVVCNVSRKDNAVNMFYGEVNEDGTVRIPLTSWMLELAGTLVCDISIISEDITVAKLTTMQFNIYVEEAAVPDEAFTETEEYSLIIDLLNRTTAAESKMYDAANTAVEAAERALAATAKVTLDDTLTKVGYAAEASAVGRAIEEAFSRIGTPDEAITDLEVVGGSTTFDVSEFDYFVLENDYGTGVMLITLDNVDRMDSSISAEGGYKHLSGSAGIIMYDYSVKFIKATVGYTVNVMYRVNDTSWQSTAYTRIYGCKFGAPGKDGKDGKDGSVWYYGTALSGNGESIMMPILGAKTGDYYLNITTGDLYVSVTGDSWWKYLITLKGGGSSVELDTTLTVAGKAADAKAVGSVFEELKAALEEIKATLEESDVEDAIAVLDKAILDLSTLA